MNDCEAEVRRLKITIEQLEETVKRQQAVINRMDRENRSLRADRRLAESFGRATKAGIGELLKDLAQAYAENEDLRAARESFLNLIQERAEGSVRVNEAIFDKFQNDYSELIKHANEHGASYMVTGLLELVEIANEYAVETVNNIRADLNLPLQVDIERNPDQALLAALFNDRQSGMIEAFDLMLIYARSLFETPETLCAEIKLEYEKRIDINPARVYALIAQMTPADARQKLGANKASTILEALSYVRAREDTGLDRKEFIDATNDDERCKALGIPGRIELATLDKYQAISQKLWDMAAAKPEFLLKGRNKEPNEIL